MSFSVMYRTLLFICSLSIYIYICIFIYIYLYIYKSLHLLTPTSHSIPSLLPCLLATISLFSLSVVLFLFLLYFSVSIS